MRAVDEDVIADAHVAVPRSGELVTSENISRFWGNRFSRDASNADAGEVVRGKRREPREGQVGSVMNQIDIVILRPRARKSGD